MAAIGIIIGFNGEAVKPVQAGSYSDTKLAFDKLAESGGGGFDMLQLIDSRCGRVRRKKFAASPAPAAAEPRKKRGD